MNGAVPDSDHDQLPLTLADLVIEEVDRPPAEVQGDPLRDVVDWEDLLAGEAAAAIAQTQSQSQSARHRYAQTAASSPSLVHAGSTKFVETRRPLTSHGSVRLQSPPPPPLPDADAAEDAHGQAAHLRLNQTPDLMLARLLAANRQQAAYCDQLAEAHRAVVQMRAERDRAVAEHARLLQQLGDRQAEWEEQRVQARQFKQQACCH